MLTYPQMIMSAAADAELPDLDYPNLDDSNAIAASTVWVVMPDLYSQDNTQTEGVLFGNATLTETGLQVPDYVSGMNWPRPAGLADALNSSGEATLIWQGIPEGFDGWANFIAVKANGGTLWNDNYEALGFGRGFSSTSGRLSQRSQAGSRVSGLSASGYIAVSANPTQFAVTVDSSNTRFYIDGVLFSSTTSVAPFIFGGDGEITLCNRTISDRDEGLISSDIDLAMICDRALSAAELTSLMNDRLQLLESGGGGGTPPVPLVDIRIEAETMDLSGAYEIESPGDRIWLSFSGLTGTASVVFPGGSGTYNMVMAYWDETDGDSSFILRRNTSEIESWTSDATTGSGGATEASYRTRNIGSVYIETGDTIEILATRDGGDHCRVDYIDFLAPD